ncbi:hypothetical protein, partial [Vibrio cholerae]|uniref:hypothetical protein n=1 Tax=Vibrio cholerae TaxID=666 RepID=UPI00301BBCF9
MNEVELYPLKLIVPTIRLISKRDVRTFIRGVPEAHYPTFEDKCESVKLLEFEGGVLCDFKKPSEIIYDFISHQEH